jgi:peptidoglycan/LPS O-acetylase OafA/YrhL
VTEYRREIDGLRAVAVLPVVLFHAGFDLFKGGYVGVDVFFVISGFLITSIIREGLATNSFSISSFYERRARRLLPALFLVMGICLAFSVRALMPDELKNFGQSLVATSLFSNNLLLAVTSGYWDLASEFKPLLHTWSLGVEEQYYLIVPLLLTLLWKSASKRSTYLVLSVVFLVSICSLLILLEASPNWGFYSLPTRAWEILLGAIVAMLVEERPATLACAPRLSDALSGLGLLLIILAVMTFDEGSPGLFMLVPTIGTALIILFTRKAGITSQILGCRAMVFIGLLSYSIYLWHQPVFAFTRSLSMAQPPWYAFAMLIPVIIILSYLSWRFVEKPFRDRRKFSARMVYGLSFGFIVIFVAAGLVLNSTYGLLNRIYGPTVSIADMDKRVYNERVFAYQKDSFESDGRKKILVVGNSFARDFVNITLEHFDVSQTEIIYRSDLDQCIHNYRDGVAASLFEAAEVVVFGSREYNDDCAAADISYATAAGKQIYYVGIKNFGFNLNWLRWLSSTERENRYNAISRSFLAIEESMELGIPAPHYISLLRPVLKDGHKVPITDDKGRMLSTDREHLTKYGAIFFGEHAVDRTQYAANFETK